MKLNRLERSVVWQMTAGLCAYCGRRTGREQGADCQFTVDHATPLSRGGRHTLSNWRPCCLACNEIKSDLTEAEFLTIPPEQREAMRAQLAAVLRHLGPVGWWVDTNREQRCRLINRIWSSTVTTALA